MYFTPIFLVYTMIILVAAVAVYFLQSTIRRNWCYFRPERQVGHANIVIWMVNVAFSVMILSVFAVTPLIAGVAHIAAGEVGCRIAIGAAYGIGLVLIAIDMALKGYQNKRPEIYHAGYVPFRGLCAGKR